MKRHDRFWCWWMSRYLLFLKKIGGRYLFTDYGDQQILLTEDEVSMLSPVDKIKGER